MKAETCDDGIVSIRCTLASTPEDVRQVLADISATLTQNACQPDPGDLWEVAVAEVLNNIVEHAYEQREDGQIRLELDFAPTQLDARFTDFGRPMPGGMPPPGAPADLDVPVEDLPEGGFGWLLIRSLADQLDYRQVDGENRLHLRLPIACSRQA